jgi:hypothetical protein
LAAPGSTDWARLSTIMRNCRPTCSRQAAVTPTCKLCSGQTTTLSMAENAQQGGTKHAAGT